MKKIYGFIILVILLLLLLCVVSCNNDVSELDDWKKPNEFFKCPSNTKKIYAGVYTDVDQKDIDSQTNWIVKIENLKKSIEFFHFTGRFVRIAWIDKTTIFIEADSKGKAFKLVDSLYFEGKKFVIKYSFCEFDGFSQEPYIYYDGCGCGTYESGKIAVRID